MTDKDLPPDGPHATRDLPAAASPVLPEVLAAPQDPAHQPPTPVVPEVAASLTDALRAMYDTVVDEPLPDAFADLLSRLDDSDG